MSRVQMRGVLVSLVLVLLAGLPARAAEERQPAKAYVVLVGISDYADKQIKPRPNAEADAKALYDLFANKDYLAEEGQVKLLLGTKDDKRPCELATRENILKAVHWAASSAKKDDLVIFAFFGQGGPLGDSGDRRCYFAQDSTVKGRDKNTVAAAELAQEFDHLKSHRFCALLDVNFMSINADPPPDVNLGKLPYKEFLGDDGTEDHGAAPGRAVFLATNGLVQGLDLKDHGLFAQALLDALKGAADREGYEPDGIVTVDELAAYLDKELGPLARQHLPNKDERVPLHFALGGQENHFALTRNPQAAAKAKARLEKFAESARAQKLPDKLVEEGTRLLERMPKLEAMRNLRKEYQKLADGGQKLDDFEAARSRIMEGMRLKRSDALAFGAKVVAATKMVVENYVKEVNQGELVGWAVRGLYQRLEEKLPAEINERLGRVKDMREGELTVLLADAREKLGKREDLDSHKDIDIALQRMLLKLDPHTTYFDPETRRRLEQEMHGKFYGIGVQIRKHDLTDTVQVVTPIKDSPAYKAGILAGDLIVKIIREVDSDGKPLEPVEVTPTKGLALADAVKRILGQPRTKVKLTIQREGVAQPLEFEITRAMVELESVVGVRRKADDTWEFMLDPERKIGYVRLTSFASNSARDLKRVIQALQEEGMRAFVLDLRFNPGGVLDGSREIANLFVDDGTIVSIRPRADDGYVMKARRGQKILDVPMVCLINGDSASASEIVSACLQDHKRALIMGERSYGKGSVQRIYPFDGGALKLTTASFWRPSGKNLNKASTQGRDEDEWGVTPDEGYLLKLSRKERDDLHEHLLRLEKIGRRDKPEKDAKEFKDRQLEMAVEYLRAKVKAS